MNYVTLLKILTEWSIDSGEYQLLFFIYETFHIGIPTNLLYKLPNMKRFDSFSSFQANHETKRLDDHHLRKLFDLFKISKYTTLSHWNGKIGYNV
jgi:hypothetical protein